MTAVGEDPLTPENNGETMILDRRSAVLMADALRKHLLLHQQMGIVSYPQTEVLQRFLHPPKRRPTRLDTRSLPSAVGTPPLRNEPSRKSVSVRAQKVEAQGDLNRELTACSNCALAETRLAQVLAQGKKGARLLIVGDYARVAAGGGSLFGRAEDELLWKMMQAIKLGPADVYVTNVVKCTPSEQHAPLHEHEQACQGYLHREIALVQPKVILAMGMSAARAILGVEDSVFRLRGRLLPTRFLGRSGESIPVMVSFHPQFLLEQPAMKKAAWQDLQIVQRQLLMASNAGKPGVMG